MSQGPDLTSFANGDGPIAVACLRLGCVAAELLETVEWQWLNAKSTSMGIAPAGRGLSHSEDDIAIAFADLIQCLPDAVSGVDDCRIALEFALREFRNNWGGAEHSRVVSRLDLLEPEMIEANCDCLDSPLCSREWRAFSDTLRLLGSLLPDRFRISLELGELFVKVGHRPVLVPECHSIWCEFPHSELHSKLGELELAFQIQREMPSLPKLANLPEFRATPALAAREWLIPVIQSRIESFSATDVDPVPRSTGAANADGPGSSSPYCNNLDGNHIPNPTSPLSALELYQYIYGDDGKDNGTKRKYILRRMQSGILPANLAPVSNHYVVCQITLDNLRRIHHPSHRSSTD